MDEGSEALTAEEIRKLGYEVQPDGAWRLTNPAAKPPPREGLCRFCAKFEALFDGTCPGCIYFGRGDPHGINADRRPPRRSEQAVLGDSPTQRDRGSTIRGVDEYDVERVREAAREVLGRG